MTESKSLRMTNEAETRTVNWCGFGSEDEGCGYIASEGTDYCHHCGREPVEKVTIAALTATEGADDA